MDPSPQEPPRSNLRASSPLRWVVPALIAALAGGAGLYVWLTSGVTPPSLEQPAARPAPDPAAAPSTAAASAADEAPATAAEAPALLERVSANPLFRAGVALPELLRRWAIVTENLALGDSPRKELSFLAPAGRFSTVSRGDRVLVAPAAWARYDAFAAAVQSVDARAAASAYRRLHGVLDRAYQALGYRAGGLDAATNRALRRIAGAPLAREDTALVEAGGVYVYADGKLEQLPEVEKHLLRMGPRNEALVQAKARELLAELALPASVSAR